MNEWPWWAYPGEPVWKSADGTISVSFVAVDGGTFELDIVVSGTESAISWDLVSETVLHRSGAQLSAAVVTEVRGYLRQASEPTLLSRPEQLAIDHLSELLGRDTSLSARAVRQRIMKTCSTGRLETQAIVAKLEPRFLVSSGDYLSIQPSGLLRSAVATEVVSTIDRALERMVSEYDDNPDVTTISFEDTFGAASDERKRMILRTLERFALARTISAEGKAYWQVPVDIEEIWSESVDCAAKLWLFAMRERRIARPWPGALVRSDWRTRAMGEALESVAGPKGLDVALDADAKDESLASTQKLPRLEVEYVGKLGSGAFGTVWEAIDKLLERKIAVKFLTATEQALDEEALLREARSLAKVSHANLVTVYGAAWLRHPATGLVAPAITMELLQGTPLQKWWQTAHPRDQSLRVAAGIVRGVQAMHDAGLHHGDLHPENVMIEASGESKLIDWRYQDTFLPRSTADRRDLQSEERRRVVDLVVTLFEKQKLQQEVQELRAIAVLDDQWSQLRQVVVRKDAARGGSFLPASSSVKAKVSGTTLEPIQWCVRVDPRTLPVAPKNERLSAIRSSMLLSRNAEQQIRVPGVLLERWVTSTSGMLWRKERRLAANSATEEQFLLAEDGSFLFQRSTFTDVDGLERLSFEDLTYDVVVMVMLASRYLTRLAQGSETVVSLDVRVSESSPMVVAYFGNGIVQSLRPHDVASMQERSPSGAVPLGAADFVDLAAIAVRLVNYCASAFAYDDGGLLSVGSESMGKLSRLLSE